MGEGVRVHSVPSMSKTIPFSSCEPVLGSAGWPRGAKWCLGLVEAILTDGLEIYLFEVCIAPGKIWKRLGFVRKTVLDIMRAIIRTWWSHA